MRVLKQSTAVTVRMGPFLDKTDGVSEETGITPVVEVSKAHAAFGARSSASAITHDAEGWFAVPLDATDTGTLGLVRLKAHDSATHLPVWDDYTVLTANVYDSLVAATDNLEVDTTLIEGADATDGINAACDTSISDAALATAASLSTAQSDLDTITGTAGAKLDVGTGAGQIALTSGAVDNVTLCATTTTNTDMVAAAPTAVAVADQVWDEAIAGHAGAGSTGEALSNASSAGDPWSTALPGAYGAGTAGKIVGDNINAPLDTIDANVDTINTATAGLAGAAMRGTDSAATAATIGTPAGADIAADLAAIKTEANKIALADAGIGSDGSLAEEIGNILANTATDIPATITTMQSDLDIITGGNGVIFNSTQANLSLATAASMSTAQADLDTLTGVTGANLLTATQASIDAIETAVGTTIPALLPAALVGGRIDADVGAISTSTTAADNLEASALAVIPGACTSSILTTTSCTSNLSGYDSDRLIGRIIVFTSSPVAGEATDITDYSSSGGVLTFTALTEAPADATTFVIV